MPNFHDVLCKMRGMGINMKGVDNNEICLSGYFYAC